MPCVTAELLERRDSTDEEPDDVIKHVSGVAYAGKYQYSSIVIAATHDGRIYQVGQKQ